MATLVDGLGFEEIGGAGSQPVAIWVTGSIVTQDAIYAGSVISGASTIVGTNISGIGSVVDGKGQLRSISIGSPQSYGALVQVGSCVTSAGSIGIAKFGLPFANTQWMGILTPSSGVGAAGSYAAAWSGAKSTTHGSFIGAPSVTYDWIAVGI